jgi:hypothetical protein
VILVLGWFCCIVIANINFATKNQALQGYSNDCSSCIVAWRQLHGFKMWLLRRTFGATTYIHKFLILIGTQCKLLSRFCHLWRRLKQLAHIITLCECLEACQLEGLFTVYRNQNIQNTVTLCIQIYIGIHIRSYRSHCGGL